MSAALAPICLGGLAGSGKTPLRRVLEAHPEILMTRRTDLWRLHGRFDDLACATNLDRCLASLAADPGARRLGPDPERLRAELATGPRTYARLFLLVHAHHAERLGARRFGEQLDGIERFTDEILAAASAARIVHMLGRPATSMRGAPWRRGHAGRELARWLAAVRLARRNQRRHPAAYLVVTREELERDPRRTIGRVCAFLDEDVHQDMEAMLEEVAS